MKKPNILLIGPYKNAGLRVGQYLAPPMGIYRIASYIKKNLDINVRVYDIDLEGIGNLLSLIKKENFDIIGFSLLYPTLKNDIPLIYKVHELCPESLLIAGGQGATFSIDYLFKKTPLQIIVKRFGEFPLADIVKNFSKSHDLYKRFKFVKNIAIKTNRGTKHTENRSSFNNEEFRDIVMGFDYSLVPYEEYWDHMGKQYTAAHLKLMRNENMLRTIRIMSSSHCPKGCKFCSSTNFLDHSYCKQKTLMLSPEEIITCIKNAIKYHPTATAIYFCDDNFLQDKERACELSKQIISQNLNHLSYFCLSRSDTIDNNLMFQLKEANFKFIIYGIESFSKTILKEMNKNILHENPAQLQRDCIINTLNHGITPLMNIILFYPTSTVKDIILTIENCIDLINIGARLTAYTYLEVYPGSRVLDEKGLDYIQEEFYHNEVKFVLPKYIVPKTNVKDLAKESIVLRESIIQSIIRKYDWKGAIPHPLYGLALFIAVYRLLYLNTDRIEKLVEKIFVGEKAVVYSDHFKVKGEC